MLGSAVDYAGLFPPAALSMTSAAAEYAEHRRSSARWALGRFVVTFARWGELEEAASGFGATAGDPWPVSVLAAPAAAPTLEAMRRRPGSGLSLVAVESRAMTVEEARDSSALVALGVETYVEAGPPGMDLDAFAVAVGQAGAAAKIRTGGVVADAFPTAKFMIGFLRACHRHGLRFKATAGLHHPVRGLYPLTYDPGSALGLMYGFLNVALAAAFVWHGRGDDVILGVLEERSLEAFAFGAAGVSWREERLTTAEVDAVREGFFAGFGSCSFREPMFELGLHPVPSA